MRSSFCWRTGNSSSMECVILTFVQWRSFDDRFYCSNWRNPAIKRWRNVQDLWALQVSYCNLPCNVIMTTCGATVSFLKNKIHLDVFRNLPVFCLISKFRYSFHNMLVLSFCFDLEGQLLQKIVVNHSSDECEEAEVWTSLADLRLFREHSPDLWSLLCMLLTQNSWRGNCGGFWAGRPRDYNSSPRNRVSPIPTFSAGSPPEWKEIITRPVAPAAKFSHFQVSISLICLRKYENFDSHSFAYTQYAQTEWVGPMVMCLDTKQLRVAVALRVRVATNTGVSAVSSVPLDSVSHRPLSLSSVPFIRQ